MFRISIFIFAFVTLACQQTKEPNINFELTSAIGSQGALLGTRFDSFEELQKVIDIEYSEEGGGQVFLTHRCGSNYVTSTLKSGVTEKDFEAAKIGQLKDKLALAFKSPYLIVRRHDLLRTFHLSRRDGIRFGEDDKSFFDLAQSMTGHIIKTEEDTVYKRDFSEKGYTNTFNHLAAQAFITSIFSEKFADYIADSHELARMPELVTGDFSLKQLNDLDNGPVDNYVDIINNEWGQELGKTLKAKYNIDSQTRWSPDLLTNYLNDVQSYVSWSFKIDMQPFRSTDIVVVKFSRKLNKVMTEMKFG